VVDVEYVYASEGKGESEGWRVMKRREGVDVSVFRKCERFRGL